ncbi:iron-siderophore ABC transporter substrate-binding protein [Streptomyces sp. SID6673]|nr:iron-siderophore ABC transporter substrate-binding protein [Streptomyces sp. SID11726]NEB23296.1 iron-siderophore ABC transporter substrate-binding protein [Streptomyces sp. SID6673]
MTGHTISRWAAMASLVACAAFLAGCGTSDASGDAAVATRPFVDAQHRTVGIPVAAKRVVALSEPAIDATLALGMSPVGITAGRGQQGAPGYLADRLDGVPIVATVGAVDLEKVAALHPDLIVLDETTSAKKELDKLSAIAPTVVTARLKADWRQAFLTAADALGKSAEGRSTLDDLDRDIAVTKSRLGSNAGASVSVVRWQNGRPAAVGQGDGPVGQTIAALGLTRPKGQQGEGPGHSAPVSLEMLNTIDADWIFFGTLGDRASGEAALADAHKLQVFDQLGGVQANHVAVVAGSAWNTTGGPLAARSVLGDLTATLTDNT